MMPGNARVWPLNTDDVLSFDGAFVIVKRSEQTAPQKIYRLTAKNAKYCYFTGNFVGIFSGQVRVKRRGKSPPRHWQQCRQDSGEFAWK